MWPIKNATTGIDLRARTLCFIVFLVLSGELCLYYAVRELLSEL